MAWLYRLWHHRLRRRIPRLLREGPQAREGRVPEKGLPFRERRRLEKHLAACRACQQELAELGAIRELLHRWPLAEAPRSFALASEAARRPGVAGPLLARAATLAAVGAVLFAAVTLALDVAGPRRQPPLAPSPPVPTGLGLPAAAPAEPTAAQERPVERALPWALATPLPASPPLPGPVERLAAPEGDTEAAEATAAPVGIAEATPTPLVAAPATPAATAPAAAPRAPAIGWRTPAVAGAAALLGLAGLAWLRRRQRPA